LLHHLPCPVSRLGALGQRTWRKVHDLLARRGVLVPYRTLQRFCAAELEFGGQRKTVRLADGEPGQELQVDFGRMGLLGDGPEGRRLRPRAQLDLSRE
jgi:hypothetical protein